MALEFDDVATGLGFPEGPVAMRDGSVLFVDIEKQTLMRLKTDETLDKVASIPGGPNGVAIGPDGAAYVCNNGGVYIFVKDDHGVTVPMPNPAGFQGGSIQRVDLGTGEVTDLYTEYDNEKLLAADDIVFDYDNPGGFWFTVTGVQDQKILKKGAVFYGTIDRAPLKHVATIEMPNGIGLSPTPKDETKNRTLYVSDTIFGRLWAFEVTGPGEVGKWIIPHVMQGMVVQTLPAVGGVFQWLDSLKVEECGKICVATLFNGGITVFSPDGTTEHVPTGDMVTTNLCFGGDDMRDVWITASGTGKILKGRWPRPGLALAHDA